MVLYHGTSSRFGDSISSLGVCRPSCVVRKTGKDPRRSVECRDAIYATDDLGRAEGYASIMAGMVGGAAVVYQLGKLGRECRIRRDERPAIGERWVHITGCECIRPVAFCQPKDRGPCRWKAVNGRPTGAWKPSTVPAHVRRTMYGPWAWARPNR